MIKRLSNPTGNVLDTTQAPAAKSSDSPITLDKRAICVHAGSFLSQDGAISFDKARIQKVIDRNNAYLNQLKREYASNVPVGAYPPVYEDHTDNTRSTVGRLLGPFTYEERDIPKVGTKVPCMISECVRFLGSENCERADDGRMFHVSIGIDEEQNDLITELSVVPEPAAPGAMLLSKGEPSVKYKIEEKDGMFLVKTPMGYLGDEGHKTKEDAIEAGEQWEKSQCAIEEGSNKKPAAKEVKLSKGEKKMSKKTEAIEGIKRLAGEFKTMKVTLVKANGEVKHMAKKAKVEGELRNLVRMRKMSPAEFRLAKMDDMAKIDESAFGLIVESYKNRASIIEAGQIGTTEAMEAGSMAKEIGMKRLKSETKKELMRLGAKVKMSEEEKDIEKKMKKMETEQEVEGSQDMKHMSEGFAGGHTKEMSDKYAEHMKHLEAAVESGDKEKAQEHLKHMKHMAEENEGKHPVGMKHLAYGGDMDSSNDVHAKKIAEMEEHLGQISSFVDRLAAGVDKLMAAEESEGHEELQGEPGLGGDEKEKQLAEGKEGKKGEEKELAAEDKEGAEKKLEQKKPEDEKHLEAEARKDMGLAEKKDDEGKQKELAAGEGKEAEGKEPKDKESEGKEEEKK